MFKQNADGVWNKISGDYYFRKYNNREVIQLINQIIGGYKLNKKLEHTRYNLYKSNFTEVRISVIGMNGQEETKSIGVVTNFCNNITCRINIVFWKNLLENFLKNILLEVYEFTPVIT